MKLIVFTDEQETEIVSLYKKINLKSIGKKFRCSGDVIKRILIKNNVIIYSGGQRFKGGRQAAQKKYEVKNKDKRSLYYKEWIKTNKETRKKYHAEWRKNNDEYKEYKRKYEQHKKNNDPWYKLVSYMRTALWCNLKERGVVKYKSTFKMLGFGVEELMKHLEKQFTPGMMWENYGEWHVDHIIPLNSAKDLSEEEIMCLWKLSNLQPLWGSTTVISGVTYNGNLNKGIK